MKRILFLFFLCTTFLFPLLAIADDEPCDSIKGYVKPAPNEVNIAPSCIGMPLNRILLVRKDGKYGAVKFIKYWTEKDGKEKYATYEVYRKEDGTGELLNKEAKVTVGRASFLPLRGLFYPLIWQPGYPFVKCGPLKLAWSAWCNICHVCFDEGADPPGEYGIELAPTPWIDIKEVNVSDPRVKWYRYDEKRKEGINIPIDKLWK